MPNLWALARAEYPPRYGLPVSDTLTFSQCYGWGVTSAYRLKIGVFCSNGVSTVWPKISSRSGPWSSPTNHFPCRKTGMIVFFLWCKNFGRSFFSFCHSSRVWQTDGRTDRRTFRSWLIRACIAAGRKTRLFILYVGGMPSTDRQSYCKSIKLILFIHITYVYILY